MFTQKHTSIYLSPQCNEPNKGIPASPLDRKFCHLTDFFLQIPLAPTHFTVMRRPTQKHSGPSGGHSILFPGQPPPGAVLQQPGRDPCAEPSFGRRHSPPSLQLHLLRHHLRSQGRKRSSLWIRGAFPKASGTPPPVGRVGLRGSPPPTDPSLVRRFYK